MGWVRRPPTAAALVRLDNPFPAPPGAAMTPQQTTQQNGPAMSPGPNETAEDSVESAFPSTTRREAGGEPPTGPTGSGGHSRRNAVLRAVGLIAVVIAWLAIAGVGGPAIGSLSTVQSNDQESFLPGAAESVQAANAAAAFE